MATPLRLNKIFRRYDLPQTEIAAVNVYQDHLECIEKMINRLAILEDVPRLATPDEIRQALEK